MKKLSLFVVVLFVSVSMFANVNPVVNPKLEELITRKNWLNKSLPQYQKKISLNEPYWQNKRKKYIFLNSNNTFQTVIRQEVAQLVETVIECDVEPFVLIEYLYLMHRDEVEMEFDDDGNFVGEEIIDHWYAFELVTSGECPDPE